MAEKFMVIPAFTMVSNPSFDGSELAAVEAAKLVEKDRVPRVVVKVLAEVRASQTPRVDILHLDHQAVANG